MKKNLIILLGMLLIMFSGCGVKNLQDFYAESSTLGDKTETISDKSTNNHRTYPSQRVFDYADVLTPQQERDLQAYIDEAENATSCDIVVVILNRSLAEYAVGFQDEYDFALTPDRYVQVYAEHFWDDNCFGYDEAYAYGGRGDGILLLDNLYRDPETNRTYTWLCTSGRVVDLIDDLTIGYILDSFYENVSIDYFQACKDYVDAFVKSMDEKPQINLASNMSESSADDERNGNDYNDGKSRTYSDDRIPNAEELIRNLNYMNSTKVMFEVITHDGQYSYSFYETINNELYDYYHNLTRYYISDDFNFYICDSTCESLIKTLVIDLNSVFDDFGYTDSQRVREAANFVQSLMYETDINAAGRDEWPKYAIETLYDKNGDCEDKSILLASILKEMGYGCCLLAFDDHVAVGIAGDESMTGYYYEMDGVRYFYIESTNTGWDIGEMPEDYEDAMANIVVVN